MSGFHAASVSIEGSIAAVADLFDGLRVVDVSDPASPRLLGGHRGAGIARGVDLQGGIAYLADGIGGLRIFDLADPHQPSLIATYPTADAAWVDAVEDVAYVTDRTGGRLHAVDISAPASPRQIGIFDVDEPTLSGEIVDGLAFLAAHRQGLLILDVSACDDCVADFDGDGAVDSRDVIAFLNAWVAEDGSADFNGDGRVDTRDFLAFLNSWATGCS